MTVSCLQFPENRHNPKRPNYWSVAWFSLIGWNLGATFLSNQKNNRGLLVRIFPRWRCFDVFELWLVHCFPYICFLIGERTWFLLLQFSFPGLFPYKLRLYSFILSLEVNCWISHKKSSRGTRLRCSYNRNEAVRSFQCSKGFNIRKKRFGWKFWAATFDSICVKPNSC